jgi:hypothetical protein
MRFQHSAALRLAARPRLPRVAACAAARAPPPLDASPLTLPPQRSTWSLTLLPRPQLGSLLCSQQRLPRFAAAALAASRLAPQLAPPPLDASCFAAHVAAAVGTSRSTGCGVAAPAPNLKSWLASGRARVALALRCAVIRHSALDGKLARLAAHVPASRFCAAAPYSARD